jgi:hypothetical protein
VSAEQLIALEAAVAELGALYAVAKGFTALHAGAETELLPRVIDLGSRLRRLVRGGHLTAEAIDSAAHEIVALGSEWRVALEQLRTSSVYQRALAALAADHQDELAQLIPQIFADLRLVRPAPTLYFPVSPSSGRRRPGSSPFLSAAACAEYIVQMLTEGIVPDSGGSEWWDTDLPFISGADAPSALDTPIALRLTGPVQAAVFGVIDAPSFRIFTPRLCTDTSIVLAPEATDEWWEAYEDSYRSFRDTLHQELTTRGQTVTVGET